MGLLSITHEPRRSFREAQNAAGAGYFDPAVGTELTKWAGNSKPSMLNLPDFFAAFFAALSIAHLRNPARPLRVLDFGGQTGDYLDYVTEMFADTLKVDWLVVETPVCVDHGRKFGNPAVTFSEALDDVSGPIDFAMFSGVLPYLPDWRAPLNHPLVRAAEHIFITRTSLATAEQAFLQTLTYNDKVDRRAARILRDSDLSGELETTHFLFASWTLQQHLGYHLGVTDAPAILWRRNIS